MEPGESLEETARREVREATGLAVSGLKLLCVLSGAQFFHVYPSGDEVFHVAAIYVAEDAEGAVLTNSQEAVETTFFDIAQRPTNMNMISRCALSRYGQGDESG